MIRLLNAERNLGRRLQNPSIARDRARLLMRLTDSVMLGIREWGGLLDVVRGWMEQETRKLYYDLGLISEVLRDRYEFDGLHGEDWYGTAPYIMGEDAAVYHSDIATAATGQTPGL